MTCQWVACFGAWCLFIGAAVASDHARQAGSHSHDPGKPAQATPQAPVRISMEELHRQGGVPRGWKFSFPEGSSTAGRDVFVKLECYQCHAIAGQSFPHSSSADAGMGPELTGMGGHHPVEYLAESILNPNAVVVTGPGFTDAAGLSIMPDYRESLTVAELIDLVAYLKSLGGAHDHGSTDPHHAGHLGHEPLFDEVVGDYRVRVMYHTATVEAHGHGDHRHDTQSGGAAKARKQGHLMAFITDARTGEAVPYLPVTLSIPSPQQAAHTVKLIPMMGDHGFHYGADIQLPRQPTTVTLSIGPASMRLMPSAAGRFSKPQDVSFNWSAAQPAAPVREPAVPHSHGLHGSPKGH